MQGSKQWRNEWLRLWYLGPHLVTACTKTSFWLKILQMWTAGCMQRKVTLLQTIPLHKREVCAEQLSCRMCGTTANIIYCQITSSPCVNEGAFTVQGKIKILALIRRTNRHINSCMGISIWNLRLWQREVIFMYQSLCRNYRPETVLLGFTLVLAWLLKSRKGLIFKHAEQWLSEWLQDRAKALVTSPPSYSR